MATAVKEKPATTLLTAKRQVWYLAIKHDMTFLERPFHIYYDNNDDVAILKGKVKAENSHI